jgi:hypothetical protein
LVFCLFHQKQPFPSKREERRKNRRTQKIKRRKVKKTTLALS